MKTILLLFLIGSMAVAQEDLRPRYGLFLGAGINLHSSSFMQLPAIPSCCPGYGSDVAIVPNAMLLAQWPIATDLLLGGRLGYAPLSGTLTRDESTRVIQGGAVVDGVFRHTIEATLNAVAIEPTITWNVYDHFFIDGGLRFSMIMSPRFDQTETIVEPSNGGTFVDASGADTRSRTRNAYSGALQDASTHLAMTASVRYELPMNENRTFIFSPDVGVGVALTQLAGVDWKVNPFHVGITVLWQPFTPEPDDMLTPQALPPSTTPALPPVLATIIPMPKTLDLSLAAYSVRTDGSLDTLERISVDETISEQITAVLPMIFFDRGGDVVPERYDRTQTAERFSERGLFGKGALDVYHSIVDIIGQRMREHPSATITLTGAIMPDSVETTASGLALRRAEHVRELLQQRWSISPDRIAVRARDLPEQPSSVKHDDGREENRRVDITSNDPAILDLVRLEDTLRTVNTPDVVFKPTIFSDTAITTWTMTCSANGTIISSQHGTGTPPSTVRIQIPEGLRDGTVDVTMSVDNAGGRHREAEAHIPIVVQTLAMKAQKRQGLKRVDEYGLILFAFGKASLEGPNARILDMVRARIEPSSTVIVRGHADRTGSAEVNLRITQDRAEAVAASLGHPRVDARGMGQRNMIYTNDLPEGRYYNRTVRVRVETPIAP